MKSCALAAIVVTSLFFFFVACGSGNTKSPPQISYAIGGMVKGLSGTGLILQDNGGANLPVSANGPFTFTADVTNGGAYKVTVLTQPSSPAQTCSVTAGSGTASANVTSVQVSCTTNPITFGVSSLNGTYVFSSTVIPSSTGANFLTMVGSLTANGTGGVTGGTVDLNGFPPTGAASGAQAITGGSYSVGADGRGQIKFDTTIAGAGAFTFTLDFVLTSSSHGLVTEFDSHGTGSGTIDLQSAITQSQLAGSYTFAFSGISLNSSDTPIATVGAFTLDSTGAVSTGQEDVNNFGSYSGAPSQILTSSAVTLGATPATATIASSAGTTYTFDVYPIDSGHLMFIENDSHSQLLLSGDAYTQGSSIPTGQLVFTLAGVDTMGGTPLFAPAFASGGWLTNSGAAITAGLEDLINSLDPSASQANSVSGSISAVSGGRSVLSLSGFVTDSIPGNYSFAAYPFTFSGGGTGIQLLEIDGLGITSGVAYAQTSTTLAASQRYGLNVSALNEFEINKTIESTETDAIAQFTTTTSGLSGFIDINAPGSIIANQTLTGSFPAPVDGNGRGTATTNYFSFDYYVVNSSTSLLFVTGGVVLLGTGTFELQNPAASPGAEPGVSPPHPAFHAHAARQQKK